MILSHLREAVAESSNDALAGVTEELQCDMHLLGPLPTDASIRKLSTQAIDMPAADLTCLFGDIDSKKYSPVGHCCDILRADKIQTNV